MSTIEPGDAKRSRANGCLVFFAAVGFLILVGFCLLPDLSHSREENDRYLCRNNLKMITLALHAYHDEYKSFPPAYIADANGQPMHSWRVLILPFMEQQTLYRKYRFDEPWDGPNNRKLHEIAVREFACPSTFDRRSGEIPLTTNYVAIVGSETMWPGSTSLRLFQISDSASETIAVAEMQNSGIHWMEPRDLPFDRMSFRINDPETPSISSGHHEVAQIGLADGSVRWVPDSIDPITVRALLTAKGGERVGNF
ncbi:MAG: DUF1559 domain-containing protein [Planctomycetaceae bacterium]